MALRELEASVRWQKLAELIRGGRVPQALWLLASEGLAERAAEDYARRVLCLEGTNCGRCPSCRCWDGSTHPDWIVQQDAAKAMTIDECRQGALALGLAPVAAPYRLLTVWRADELLPPAANSLLKITEEPPPRGRRCFVSSTPNLSDTLHSRAWMLSLQGQDVSEPAEPPSSDAQWAEWFVQSAAKAAEEWQRETAGWAAWCQARGDLRRASVLSQISQTARNAHLSSSQWADLLVLIMREDYPCEYVFDDLRQASIFRPSRRGR